MSDDFDTANLVVKAYTRYSFGWTDMRGAFGASIKPGGGAIFPAPEPTLVEDTRDYLAAVTGEIG